MNGKTVAAVAVGLVSLRGLVSKRFGYSVGLTASTHAGERGEVFCTPDSKVKQAIKALPSVFALPGLALSSGVVSIGEDISGMGSWVVNKFRKSDEETPDEGRTHIPVD